MGPHVVFKKKPVKYESEDEYLALLYDLTSEMCLIKASNASVENGDTISSEMFHKKWLYLQNLVFASPRQKKKYYKNHASLETSLSKDCGQCLVNEMPSPQLT